MELFARAAFKLFYENKIGVLLIVVAIITCVISMLMFLESSNGYGKAKEPTLPDMETSQKPSTISVQIAGAVAKPQVYEIPTDYRLKDLLVVAGGLSEKADEDYFYRTFNLAKKLNDQDKIYVPTKDDIAKGDYKALKDSVATSLMNDARQIINVNTATEAELDTLPGVGPSTAAKIVQNRPYAQLDDLLVKKVLGNAAFQKLKNQLSIE